MKTFQLIISIILLVLVLYYYNKSKTYEKVEHLENVDSLIEQIASITNGDLLKLNNVEITGTLTVPNITTTNINSIEGDKGWVNIRANVHNYKEFQSDGLIYGKNIIKSDKNIESPNITTRYLEATKDGRIDAPSLYVRNQLFTKDIQPTKWDSSNKDTVNINAKTNINNTLTSQTIIVNKKLDIGTKKEEGDYNKAGIFYWTHPLKFDGNTLKKAW